MTAPVSKSVAAAGKIDAPIFDPLAFRLNDEQAGHHRDRARTRPDRVRRPRRRL